MQQPRRGWTKRLTIDGVQELIRQQRALFQTDRSSERFSAILGLTIVLAMLNGHRKMERRTVL